ncbi:uncharacterized protein BKA55DRAFT_538431 [Fusarium redolens]|uniref:Uncharacterized protein n=1 Tax=Fusarium redolens TaxID=48865 RepID=A0A9P9H9E1_FUSRE|nr:uncharacterized protein BKA55DRAFT_538431 [Fusarium redolens]KAH7253564.1 hypothetical protein BKA55DRAFT_538431 [Fusarium redolens]
MGVLKEVLSTIPLSHQCRPFLLVTRVSSRPRYRGDNNPKLLQRPDLFRKGHVRMPSVRGKHPAEPHEAEQRRGGSLRCAYHKTKNFARSLISRKGVASMQKLSWQESLPFGGRSRSGTTLSNKTALVILAGDRCSEIDTAAFMLLHVIQLLKLAHMFYHVSLDLENHEYDDEDGLAQSQSNKDFKRAILLCCRLLERRDGTTGLTARAASETEKPQVSWLFRPRSSVDLDGTNWSMPNTTRRPFYGEYMPSHKPGMAFTPNVVGKGGKTDDCCKMCSIKRAIPKKDVNDTTTTQI